MDRIAYVDESELHHSADVGIYLLGATIIPDDLHDELRAALRAHLRPGARKVHWHDEGTSGRDRLVSLVTSFRLDHVVVVCSSEPSARSERRRRLCLERLCNELHARDVSLVKLESRGPSDKLDRALVDALRSKRQLAGSMRIEHVPGPAEPLLWIADALCGAVTQHRRGNPSHLRDLGSQVHLTEI